MNQVPFRRPEDLPATFGRYRVLKLLGQGGMGAVYLATDTQLDRPVALKIPHFEGDDGSKVLERFQREARAAATILHPNVCPLHEVGEIDGVPYLTMGYIEGKPLSAFVAAKPLQPRQCALLVRKLALALAEAHKRGVIHRDLKPANIMIDRRSEPIIMDFGLARRARTGDPRLTQMGTTMGTPAYMPPEQVNGDIDAMGPASDIYSLGVILYELLTGRLPFVGDAMAQLSQVLLDEPLPPSQIRPEVGGELEAICLKAMAKKIPDRYASMTDLAAALQAYLRSKGPAEPLPPGVASAKTPTPAPTAATIKPGFNAKPAFGSPEERDAFLWAPTLKPGLKVRDQGEVRPFAERVADTPPNKPAKKTARASRLTENLGGVPLWVWIAGAAAATAAVAVMLVVLLLIFLPKAPDTHLSAGPAPTVPAPTNPAPTKPAEPGTIAFKPSEPAPGVELKVDGVAAPSWGEPLELSVGEHDVEVIGKEFMPFHKKITVQSGHNPTLHLELFRRALAPAKLLVPCDRTGNAELYLMNPDGGAPVQLTKSEKGTYSAVPAWSPDGKQIAFLAGTVGGKHHVFVMSVEDQTVRQLTSWAWSDHCVDWSVNGQLVIGSFEYDKGVNHPDTGVIHVMNADGSNQATKLTPDGAVDIQPAWSPDGKKIVFGSKRDGNPGFNLYVMNADGTRPRPIAKLNTPFINTSSAAWHPEGKRIAYQAAVGQANEIFVIDLDGSSPVQLTKLGGDNHAPAWNPDGKQIAFLHNTTALYLLNVRTTPEFGLLNPDIYPPPQKILEEKAIYRPAWKPRPFLDTPAEYGTIRFEPSEPAPQVVLTVDGVAGYSWGEPLRLTPGDHFVGAIGGKEYMPISRLFTVKPGQNPTPRFVLLKLAPDNLIVPCGSNGTLGLRLLSPDGSTRVQWTKLEKGAGLGQATWSPDGKQIVFSADSPGAKWQLHVLNVKDQKVRPLWSGAPNDIGIDVDWSVAGQLVFGSLKDGQIAIYVMKADGSNQPTKLTPDGAEDLYPAWSPDGKKIVCASKRDGHKGYSLYIMDADGKNPRQIPQTDLVPSLSMPAWHPDGKRIAYAEAVGQAFEIFTIDLDGANKKQVTRLGGANGAPAWSPDGKQLAFTHDNMILYLLNTDGDDPPRKILEEQAVFRPAWRPRMVVGD